MKTQQALLLVSLGLVAIVAAAPRRESALRPSDANGREAAEIKGYCYGDWKCSYYGDCCSGIKPRKKLL